MKNLSIYVHIPFCVRKCRYCDFLSFPAPREEREAYVRLLLREIEMQAGLYRDYRVVSVFLGGGTPSLLDGEEIETILCKLKERFAFSKQAEITIEVNPGTVTEDKLAAYVRAGINRLSIGLQSADEEELKLLGRIHDYEDFVRTYELARKAGFRNINVDLISAIPGQTAKSCRNTLEKVLALSPEHISAYSLIIEENTWFYEHQKELPQLSEEEDRTLYEMTGNLLSEFNYNRYEISNYARKGRECVHNKVYWQRGCYVGFGLGAASMVEEARWSNARTMAEYERRIRDLLTEGENAIRYPSQGSLLRDRARFAQADTIQVLGRAEQMEEFMFLGLRLMEGVSRRTFAEKFGVSMEEVYGGVLEKLCGEGLIVQDPEVRLTSYGIDISNYVLAQFLEPNLAHGRNSSAIHS